jgi:hypothetical protein
MVAQIALKMERAKSCGSTPGGRAVLSRPVGNALIVHAEELTALDSAIGGGDHGHNMKRGFAAVLQDLEAVCRPTS